MKNLTCIFILISVNSFGQIADSGNTSDPQGYYEMIEYVSNPNQEDTLCIAGVNRAKKDLEEGKLVFTQMIGFLFGHIRYESELIHLCKENGLYYSIDMISDVVYEGQTQGCYGAFMDKKITEIFGNEFKEKLRAKADSLFLAKVNIQNETVQYWDCDERPRLPNELERTSDYLTTIKLNNLNIIEDESDYGGWPFVDLGFIVEKDSAISGFYIDRFVPHLRANEKFRGDYFKIAVNELKNNYSKWIPGTIKNIPVKTSNVVRIFFSNGE